MTGGILGIKPEFENAKCLLSGHRANYNPGLVSTDHGMIVCSCFMLLKCKCVFL